MTENSERAEAVSYIMGAAAKLRRYVELIDPSMPEAELARILNNRCIIALEQTAGAIQDGHHVNNDLVSARRAPETTLKAVKIAKGPDKGHKPKGKSQPEGSAWR